MPRIPIFPKGMHSDNGTAKKHSGKDETPKQEEPEVIPEPPPPAPKDNDDEAVSPIN